MPSGCEGTEQASCSGATHRRRCGKAGFFGEQPATCASTKKHGVVGREH